MQIQKPLLAGKYEPDKAQFPMLATPKIDGIRFLMVNGVAVSRTFKPIRNEYIQTLLGMWLPDGVDGELTSGDSFQDCGNIMRIKGTPEFHIWLFDYVNPLLLMKGYETRMMELQMMEKKLRKNLCNLTILYPTQVDSQEELDELNAKYTSEGYEGTMVRQPRSPYKFGRSTTKEGILLKVKAFSDSEATIVGFQELMRNKNEQKRDVFGLAERSHEKDGMMPAGTLGAFQVEWQGKRFNCGSGLNDELRARIWHNRDKYLGKTIKFKYQEEGIKEETGVPRLPIFLGFRDLEDI